MGDIFNFEKSRDLFKYRMGKIKFMVKTDFRKCIYDNVIMCIINVYSIYTALDTIYFRK